jgi:predicted PurR-regulated permease PerM
MGTFSMWHIVILALVLSIVIYPISKILRRAGWNGWLSLLWLIPLVNIVILWVFAFGQWPTLPQKSN